MCGEVLQDRALSLGAKEKASKDQGAPRLAEERTFRQGLPSKKYVLHTEGEKAETCFDPSGFSALFLVG